MCPPLQPEVYNTTTDGSGWRNAGARSAVWGREAWHGDTVQSVCLDEVYGKPMKAILGTEESRDCYSGIW